MPESMPELAHMSAEQTSIEPRALLDGARVDDAVFALRPDYRALLIAVTGIEPGPSDDLSEGLLVAAETSARNALAHSPVDHMPSIAAWREAYRAFGAKPQRTRNSLEALTRRAEAGLPRVNRLTDIYNAISVLHQIPLGGEDLDGYVGAPWLTRADGTESFVVMAEGAESVEHPEPGEVIWRDDEGVTCRRWNWRQTRRTQLRDDTTNALFILDALDATTDDALDAAASQLLTHLLAASPRVVAVSTVLRAV